MNVNNQLKQQGAAPELPPRNTFDINRAMQEAYSGMRPSSFQARAPAWSSPPPPPGGPQSGVGPAPAPSGQTPVKPVQKTTPPPQYGQQAAYQDSGGSTVVSPAEIMAELEAKGYPSVEEMEAAEKGDSLKPGEKPVSAYSGPGQDIVASTEGQAMIKDAVGLAQSLGAEGQYDQEFEMYIGHIGDSYRMQVEEAAARMERQYAAAGAPMGSYQAAVNDMRAKAAGQMTSQIMTASIKKAELETQTKLAAVNAMLQGGAALSDAEHKQALLDQMKYDSALKKQQITVETIQSIDEYIEEHGGGSWITAKGNYAKKMLAQGWTADEAMLWLASQDPGGY